MESVNQLTYEIVKQFGASTPLCSLPEAELQTAGKFTAWLQSVSGSDQTAYLNMRDNHSWSGTVAKWLADEARIAVDSAIENAE